MDREEIKGAVDKTKGKIKEGIGKATGNERLETEGELDQVEGEVREEFGKARGKAKEALDDVKDAFNKP